MIKKLQMKMKGAALQRAPVPFCRPCFTSDAQWNGTGRTLRLLCWLWSAGARAPFETIARRVLPHAGRCAARAMVQVFR